jgi:Holliday junction DNA helicase RuvA
MIGRLSGLLLSKAPPQVLIDVAGVGYEVDVPMSTFYDLPPAGDRVVLLTHMVVREDAQLLYGFLTESERAAFRELIRISGIGPRMALAVLSGLSVADLAQAITLQESGRLIKVPGSGTNSKASSARSSKGQGAQHPRPTMQATSCVRCCRLAIPSAKRHSPPSSCLRMPVSRMASSRRSSFLHVTEARN